MQGQCRGGGGVLIQKQCNGGWDAGCSAVGFGIRRPVSTVMQDVCAGLSSAAASGNKAVMHVA